MCNKKKHWNKGFLKKLIAEINLPMICSINVYRSSPVMNVSHVQPIYKSVSETGGMDLLPFAGVQASSAVWELGSQQHSNG